MAFLGVAFALHWFLPVWKGFKWSYPILGAAISICGFAIMMWGWWLFQKRNIAICPTAHTGKLIFDGPYRFSRNPMYLGIVMIFLGVAVFMGTPPFFLGAAIYFVILNSVFIPFEEQKLVSAFGSEYLEYKRRVRRWL